MKRLTRMYMKLQMDRDVDPSKHYISPGGYECCDKNFDFNEHEGGRVTGHPDQVEFWMRDFDDTLGTGAYEDIPITISPEDVEVGFAEFCIYTGEPGEPKITPKKILELSFEFYDDEKDEYFEKEAPQKVLDSINEGFDKPYALYYCAYTERNDDDGHTIEFDHNFGVAHVNSLDTYNHPESIYEVYDDEQGTVSGVQYFKTFKEAQEFRSHYTSSLPKDDNLNEFDYD